MPSKLEQAVDEFVLEREVGPLNLFKLQLLGDSWDVGRARLYPWTPTCRIYNYQQWLGRIDMNQIGLGFLGPLARAVTWIRGEMVDVHVCFARESTVIRNRFP